MISRPTRRPLLVTGSASYASTSTAGEHGPGHRPRHQHQHGPEHQPRHLGSASSIRRGASRDEGSTGMVPGRVPGGPSRRGAGARARRGARRAAGLAGRTPVGVSIDPPPPRPCTWGPRGDRALRGSTVGPSDLRHNIPTPQARRPPAVHLTPTSRGPLVHGTGDGTGAARRRQVSAGDLTSPEGGGCRPRSPRPPGTGSAPPRRARRGRRAPGRIDPR